MPEFLLKVLCDEQIFNAKFWCIIFAIAFALFLFLYIKTKRNLKSDEYFLNVVRDVSKSIAEHHEISAFCDDGDLIYTTNPGVYENKEEFLQNISKRITASENYKNFCKSFLTNSSCNTVISGSGTGLNNQFKKWLATVNILDDIDTLSGGVKSVITLIDVTKQFVEEEKLLKNYNRLEEFIDCLPFGIFYTNKSGNIVGVNTTFANMVNVQKDKLIGLNISEFIENVSHKFLSQKQIHSVIKPKLEKSFPVSIFRYAMPHTSLVQSWIVYKGNADTSDDKNIYNNEELFIRSPIASVIIKVSGEIILYNKSFENLVQTKLTNKTDTVISKGSNICSYLPKSILTKFVSQLKSSYDTDKNTGTLLEQFEILFKEAKLTVNAYISRSKNTIIVQFVDISHQKVLEQQFMQSQKMQAIGQLAGGIAHDFNNLLTAMIGFCDLLLQKHTHNDSTYGDVSQIRQNAVRASNLVKQLLAFSRQQTLLPKVISVTETLVELSSLLRRLVGANIELQIIHGRELWNVKIDKNQFEQVIVNLVINSKDAIQNYGNIKISTKNFFAVHDFRCVYDIAHAGEYVVIEIIDDGYGISEEDMLHIFEPFYSNKRNKTENNSSGTGLGLATVYGIISQCGGYITVKSEIKKGTSFKIFLPKSDEQEITRIRQQGEYMFDLTGTSTILLVEDEDPVRKFTSRALRDNGYKVIEASCADEAIKAVENEQFDLLITDIIMPKMDGPTLNKFLREKYQGFKTIFISGYAIDTFRQEISKENTLYFIQKPFSLKELLKKVKEVLSGYQ